VLAPVVERESAPGCQVLDRTRDENFARTRDGRNPRTDGHGEAGSLSIYDFAFTRVNARADLEPDLAVRGDIAVYSTPLRSNAGQRITESAIRALNLSNGKDRPVGRLPGQINLARIDSSGLVYTNNNWTDSHGYENKLVFVPFRQVAAAVS
jgi:hypothetical protein